MMAVSLSHPYSPSTRNASFVVEIGNHGLEASKRQVVLEERTLSAIIATFVEWKVRVASQTLAKSHGQQILPRHYPKVQSCVWLYKSSMHPKYMFLQEALYEDGSRTLQV